MYVDARGGDIGALADQLELYARAVDRTALANAAWRKAGRPMTAENPNGSSGVHPLLKAIEDADRAVWRYGRALGLTVPGLAQRPGRRTASNARVEMNGDTADARRRRRRNVGDPRLALLKKT